MALFGFTFSCDEGIHAIGKDRELVVTLRDIDEEHYVPVGGDEGVFFGS
jgi:hypothetical protein